MSYPTSIDNLANSRASADTDKLSSPNHLTHHVNEDTAIEALETKVGIDNSAVITSIDYLLKNENSINPGHKHNFLSALDGDPAQAIYVDGAGNVGIGTTTPNYKLTVGNPGNSLASWYNLVTSGGLGVVDAGTNSTVGITNSDSKGHLFAYDYGGNSAEDLILNEYGGNVGIGTTDPKTKLDINSDILRLRTAKTPASASAAGDVGSICWDTNYIYVCVATNTWKRVAINSW